MSHFVVIVVTENFGDAEVEAALYPYYEQPDEGDERMEFKLRIADADLDQAYQDWKAERADKIEELTKKGEPIPDYYQTTYNSAREWVEEGQGWGYYHNPNSKWDWYVIGGRWAGYFLPRAGSELGPNLTRPGVFDNVPEQGWVDQIRKKDVDWIAMQALAAEGAEKAWPEIEKKRKTENPEYMKWAYGIQPDDTKEKYIERSKRGAGAPFAMVIEGKWYEKGEMGWWAVVHDPKRACDWISEFDAFMAEIPDDAVLTAVDCHI
jgi:hypothetical protein